MQEGLRQAFKPSDHAHRARDALASCTQRGSVLGYTTAFRRCLLQCPTVTEDKALHHYVRGLRDTPRKWVQMRSPTTLHKALLIAERYDSTFVCGDNGQ